jgi:mono/diheme cytochrome c family protein
MVRLDPVDRSAAVLAAVVVALVAGGCGGGDSAPKTAAERVAAGQKTYQSICAACHGRDLRGTAAGPSMLAPVFAPGTHPDSAFYAAVDNGVSPHGHFEKSTWGAMPALPTLDRDDLTNVIAYIRSQQRAAGIGAES